MHVPVEDSGLMLLLGDYGDPCLWSRLWLLCYYRMTTGLLSFLSKLAPAVRLTPDTWTSASVIGLGMCKERSRWEASSSCLLSSLISFLYNSFAFYISLVKSDVSWSAISPRTSARTVSRILISVRSRSLFKSDSCFSLMVVISESSSFKRSSRDASRSSNFFFQYLSVLSLMALASASRSSSLSLVFSST